MLGLSKNMFRQQLKTVYRLQNCKLRPFHIKMTSNRTTDKNQLQLTVNLNSLNKFKNKNIRYIFFVLIVLLKIFNDFSNMFAVQL